jgi:hypothetical protein
MGKFKAYKQYFDFSIFRDRASQYSVILASSCFFSFPNKVFSRL